MQANFFYKKVLVINENKIPPFTNANCEFSAVVIAIPNKDKLIESLAKTENRLMICTVVNRNKTTEINNKLNFSIVNNPEKLARKKYSSGYAYK